MLPSAHAQLSKTPGIPPFPRAFLIATLAFLALLAGFVVTAGVRVLRGIANSHHF